MLVIAGGRERTVEKSNALFASAGLELERIVPTRSAFDHRSARGLNILDGGQREMPTDKPKWLEQDSLGFIDEAATFVPDRFYTAGGRQFVELDVRVVAPLNGALSPLARAEAARLQNQPGIDAAILRLYDLLGQSNGTNELLSYLLFEPQYFAAQFGVARADARRQIANWGAAVFV